MKNLLSKILNDKELSLKADRIRKDVVDICVKNGAGHIAPSLSTIDILSALYYRIMNISLNPEWEERDRLIFSKAHGCYGLYAILVDIGYIAREEWINFYKGSSLSGCMERNVSIGLEAGCGALGHGLPIATGIAFGAKIQNKKYRVYCITGDGETQEGSTWESLQFAVKHELANLIIIIDNNKLQAMDFLENILIRKNKKDDLKTKIEAFGCVVEECNGHNITEINSILNRWCNSKNTVPQVLIAHTIKGYGLLCMENIAKFHFRLPTEEELNMGKRYE